MVWVLSLKQKIFGCFDSVFSEAGTLNYRVPSGSILGLLLSLLYINDLPQLLSESDSYLYAGDTCIFYQREDGKKLKMF